MGALFHTFIYQPLYNTLIFLYNVIPGADFGIAIIAITLLLRFLLVPIYKKQIESQKKLQELQPKIKEVQKKTKGNKEQQAKELMELYKEHKTNPFSGCLPLIIQLIFLIAIYRILINISDAGLTVNPSELRGGPTTGHRPDDEQANAFPWTDFDLGHRYKICRRPFTVLADFHTFHACATDLYPEKRKRDHSD
ncbi:MAG: Membrane protein insertase YidC [Parcubacteria group bacterium GW2011_GWC1_45_14]|nr:MAG: Membrane protein insertase YidC [Parcubacteria group bacterium GW2011_GWC1_45_14]